MIPMIDLKKNYEDLKQEMLSEITEVLQSGQFILGKKVTALEEQIKTFLKVNHALAVASGTDALHIALKALGIGKGDEVITTPFTFFATVEAIVYTGAKPVFVDVDEQTFNIDPALIEEKITERTKAILPVHLFGHPADMDLIVEIAKGHNLKVIEDCAQSFGGSFRNIMTGAFADAGCFSFYPTKNLGGYGDGGMVVFRDSALVDTMRRLRNHGSLGNYIHEGIGLNSRLDELQAAVLLVKLRRISQYNEQRRQVAGLYNELLQDCPVQCPIQKEGAYHVYHQYTIKTKHRDFLQQRLRSAGISSVVYYPVPIHLQKAMSYLGHRPGDLPVAERLSKEVLSLPIYPELPKDDIYRICEVIRDTLRET